MRTPLAVVSYHNDIQYLGIATRSIDPILEIHVISCDRVQLSKMGKGYAKSSKTIQEFDTCIEIRLSRFTIKTIKMLSYLFGLILNLLKNLVLFQ